MNDATQNLRILLIDANDKSAVTLTRCLRVCGYAVSRCAQLTTSYDHQDEPAAIVVHIAGSVENPAEVISGIVAVVTPRPTSILAVIENERIAESVLAAGADDFLVWPCGDRAIAARMHLLTRQRALRHELWIANEHRSEHARTLLALLDLSAVLSSCQSLDEVLDSIIATATGLTQARHAAILLPDANTHDLVVTAVAGAAPLLAKGQRLPADHGVMCAAMRSGAVTPLRRGDLGSAAERGGEERPVIGVCIPLRSPSQPDAQLSLGVMYLSWREPENQYGGAIHEMLELIGNLAAVSIEGALTRFWRDEARDSLVLALVELAERRDNDTARHLDRVTAFAVLLAQELCQEARFAFIDDTFIEELRRSAPLHDIGKVAIPDSILLKPGKLTVPEMEIMKTHTLVGAEAIRAVRKRLPNSKFGQMAEDIARHHHERYDGTGYPFGAAGDAIPLAARIVALADVYDALTTERSYKKALTHEEAAQIIVEGAGTHFDPQIVEAFNRRANEIREFARKLSDAQKECATEPASEIPMHWYLHARSGSLIAAPAAGTHRHGRFVASSESAADSPSIPSALLHAAFS
ncbi:MAG: HD domain-containing protein, partial [Phycisphaerales bacterium]|nr:HD domain-containing protein [Phycisphaerales bacterium]